MLASLTSLLSTYCYGLVFGLILLESAGLPLPGETMLLLAVANAASGHLSLMGVILSAATEPYWAIWAATGLGVRAVQSC